MQKAADAAAASSTRFETGGDAKAAADAADQAHRPGATWQKLRQLRHQPAPAEVYASMWLVAKGATAQQKATDHLAEIRQHQKNLVRLHTALNRMMDNFVGQWVMR